MESPMIEERKGVNATTSWGFNSSVHSSIMAEEQLIPQKLNLLHYLCIGVFIALAGCSIAATIYAFAS